MKEGSVNRYFAEHPEMVLGEETFADKLYAGRYAVKPRKDQNLAADLYRAIEKLPAAAFEPPAAERAQGAGESTLDWANPEKKDGSFYLKDGELYQTRDGAGRPVARRGAGVEGGLTAAEVERIAGLIPIRDALRDVYAANLADDPQKGDAARKQLNRHYDAFVKKFGPINKAEIKQRRPNLIQQESARAEAREEARYAGTAFEEGSFDATPLFARGASLSEIARARAAARDLAKTAGKPFDEGSFDPEDMPDVVIERRPNIDAFMDDPESYRLRAIEEYDDNRHTAEKSRVFFENILTKVKPPQINSTNDALLYALNQRGHVDIPYIAEVAKKTPQEVIDDLGSAIFKLPGTLDSYVLRDEYLSGNVREKLKIAKAEAVRNPEFKRNVEALEAVQPTPLAPSQIAATLGMPWIPPAEVESFGRELGLERLKVTYIPALAQWIVEGDKTSAAATSTWGTSRRSAVGLLEDLLNRKPIKIYDTFKDPDGRTQSVLNIEATEGAIAKAAELSDKWANWVWAEPERAERLSALYNDNYNNLVVREYDGSYLSTPGISTAWSWFPHQKRVVARIVQAGNTYVAHAVGAGKTSEMIGAGMEMRRLGLVKKPMYVVPNHMLAQFTNEFYQQYPTAKIAVADERRFHTDRRKQFIANVANDDLDAVIITHSAFGKIPISEAFARQVVNDEIDHYRDMLEQIPKDNEHRITRSRIEKQIERLEQRLIGREGQKKDQVVTFEEMGVDFLFIDEAHLFRKLDFATQMSNMKGISPEGSQMSWDLHVKSLYLDSLRPGRNLVLASGTPITNTMAELYTVSRYLQRDELAKRGLSQFDAWAGAFGEPVSELEQDAAGGYKQVTRFARFVNTAELSAMVRQVMDVVTSKQLDRYVVRPKIEGGKRQMHLAEKSPALARYQASLAERMKAIAARRGPPKPGDDIMLSVINDGRHAAIDMRLVGAKSDPNSKLTLLVNEVHRIWKETRNTKFYGVKDGAYDLSKPIDSGPATQLVFANLGLSGARHGFAVPDFIRAELIRRGVPKAQIANIADYKTSLQKQKLFNDVNAGLVRVLIGSTAKLGVGTNVQKRLRAIHNLDPLWYPADDEQRNGRGLRQGNQNPEIGIHDYSTKGTYDSSMWGLMEKKARFIEGFFEGDGSIRDMDDLGEASQYEQAKAITTNDPRLIKFTELKQALQKATRRAAAFDQELHAVRRRRAMAKTDIANNTQFAADLAKDIARRKDISGENFQATIGKVTYAKRVEFGEALLKSMDAHATRENLGRAFVVGEIAGFPIEVRVIKAVEGPASFAELKLTGHERTIKADVSAAGAVRSIEAIVSGLDADRADLLAKVEKDKKFLVESEKAANAKFSGQAEIDALTRQVREMAAELAKSSAAEKQPVAADPAELSSLDALRSIGVINELQPIESRLPFVAMADQPRRPEPVAARLTGSELGAHADIKGLREAAYRYYEDNFVKRGLLIKNDRAGFQIGFSPIGLRRTTRGGEDLLRLVPAIPDMLKTGSLLSSEPDRAGRPDVKAVHSIAARVDLAGKPIDVILKVRETKEGRYQYSLHRDRDFEPGARSVSSRPQGGAPPEGRGAPPALEGGPGELNITPAARSGKGPIAGMAEQPGARWYHSAVMRAVETARHEQPARGWQAFLNKDDKAAPNTWLGYLKRSPNVKAEELAWLGLEDWLRAHKEPVSKQEIADYVKAHEVQITETELGGRVTTPAQQQALLDALQKMWEAGHIDEFQADEMFKGALEGNADAIGALEGLGVEDSLIAPFRDAKALPDDIDEWTMGPERVERSADGQDEYSITPLTLPSHGVEAGTGIDAYHDVKSGEPLGYSVFVRGTMVAETEGFEQAVHRLSAELSAQAGGTQYGHYTLPGGERYRELLLTLPTAKRGLEPGNDEDVKRWHDVSEGAWQDLSDADREVYRREYREDHPRGGLETAAEYRSPHWAEPNVLAHVRFNDRVIDGKKTLFLEEIQSDWHQKGKKYGYRGERRQHFDALTAEYQKWRADNNLPQVSANELALAETLTPEQQHYCATSGSDGAGPKSTRSRWSPTRRSRPPGRNWRSSG